MKRNITNDMKNEQNESRSMVEIRLIKSEDEEKNWESVPIAAHMPNFLTGELANQNIEKRIRYLYGKSDPEIKKIRWNYRGMPTGHWISP